MIRVRAPWGLGPRRTAVRRTATRRTRRSVVGLVAVLGLVVAACGDDDGGGAGAATEPDGTAQPDGTPIGLGLLVDITGPASGSQGSSREVAEAWAAHVNDEGGIAGHPVELDVQDTRGDAPTASTAAEELIADDSIAAVLVVDSAGEAAVGETLSAAAMPVVGGAGYNPTVWHALPYWYGVSTSFPQVVNMQVAAAREVGAEVVVGAPCAEIPACASAAPVFEAAADALEVTYEGQVEIAADAPDYTAECLEFLDRGAQYVQLSVSNPVAIRLADDCALQGFDGWFGVSAGGVVHQLYDTVRSTGGLHGFPWWVDDDPVAEYRSIMTDAGHDEEVWGHPTATALYASLELFATTMEANEPALDDDELTRAEVIAAYGGIEGETLDGLLPQPISFSADEPAPPVTCFWLYTAEGGELDGGFEPQCGDDFGL